MSMNFNFILSKFQNVKKNSNGSYQCSCPLPAHKHGDKNPSLTITEHKDKIGLYCHVCGKVAKEVFQTVGLEERDLFKKNWNKEDYPVKPVPGNNGKSHTMDYIRDYYNPVEAEYNYYDEKCNLTDRKLRHKKKGNKDFAFCHPVDKDKWDFKKSGLPGLYGLLEIMKAKKRGVKLFGNPEGEKDADTLLKIGIPSFTSGGVNTFKEDHIKILNKILDKDDTVIIFWDYDTGGVKDKEERIKLYSKAIFKIKSIDLPGLIIKENHGEDITDWLQAGHTKKELEEIINNTSAYIYPEGAGDQEPEKKKVKTLLDYDLNEEDLNLPSEWLVPEILSPYTITMLFSRSGGGKSFFTLLLSLSLLEQGKIDTLIYLDNDNSKQALIGRKIGDIKRQFKEKFIYVPSFKTDKELMKVLLDDLKDKKYGHCLIIVDSIRNFMSGKNPNDDKDAIAFMDDMKQIRGYDNTVIMLHHLNKSGQVKNNTSFGDYSDLSYFMETNNDKKQKRIFVEFSCNPDMGCKDRIGARENFIATIDYDIMQLIIGESGVNPEDFEFTSSVKDLLKTHGELKQIEIIEKIKDELDIKKGSTQNLLLKYTDVIWKYRKGKKNSNIYSLIEDKKEKDLILHYKYNNNNNLLATGNTDGTKERMIIPEKITGNTDSVTERVMLPEKITGNTKETENQLSTEEQIRYVNNGVNTVLPVAKSEKQEKIQTNGVNTVLPVFCKKMIQINNEKLATELLDIKKSPHMEQINNDCIKDYKRRYNEALRDYEAKINIEQCKDVMRETIGNLKAMGINATDGEIQRGFELCRI